MSNLEEKLTQLSSDQTSEWNAVADYRLENREWLKKSSAIAKSIRSVLKAQSLSEQELAEKLNISPQQITRIVQGQENLTLETIAKLEKALGIEIISLRTLIGKPLSKSKNPLKHYIDLSINVFRKDPPFIIVVLCALCSLFFMIKTIIERFF